MLFVGNQFVGESWFKTFEEGGTAKDSEVCNAGLALEAVLIGRCWFSILVNNILGQADIDDVNCIGIGMMKEGAAKSCIVKENVGGVVDFTPCGFAYTVHLLMFRSSSFNLKSSDVHSEMNLVEVKADPASVRMKWTDWVWRRSSVL